LKQIVLDEYWHRLYPVLAGWDISVAIDTERPVFSLDKQQNRSRKQGVEVSC
jgi:alpha-tubulin suppressor-like RCC1 family protein